jgi:hypothetical protein
MFKKSIYALFLAVSFVSAATLDTVTKKVFFDIEIDG